MNYIPYGRQSVSEEDIQAVVKVLRSDFLTQGPVVQQFETAFASRVGAEFAISTTNATSALHLACLALGVGPGDVVWTSAVSFVASANCALYCGASVDFVDIDAKTSNMSIDDLRRKLAAANLTGSLPKVVIPVHLSGEPCDMESIHRLSKEYGFKVVEDASHAVGAKYRNTVVGDCAYSDITVFSFHPVKIITTGEGGIATTNNSELASRMARLRSHGITRDPREMTQQPDGPWYYQQLELGFNYRLTDIQAALGLSQLESLDEFLRRRHEIANFYDDALSGSRFQTPERDPSNYSSLHLYVIQVPGDKMGNRNQVFEALRANGVLVNLHYIPIYKHPFYQQFGYSSENFPNSETYYRRAISLPIFPGLSQANAEAVIDLLGQPIGHQTLF